MLSYPAVEYPSEPVHVLIQELNVSADSTHENMENCYHHTSNGRHVSMKAVMYVVQWMYVEQHCKVTWRNNDQTIVPHHHIHIGGYSS
jgi:hypothetical protein